MIRKDTTLITAIFLFFCLAGGASAATAEKQILGYDIYAGGARTVSARIITEITGSSYKTDLNLEIAGPMRHVYPWKGRQSISGKTTPEFIPSEFTRVSDVYGETKTTTMKYDKSGNLISSETLIIEGKKITQYPDDISKAVPRNAYDLLTAITILIKKHDKNDNPCEARIPVFDGKRRFDLVLSPLGKENLKPNRYSVFSGDTYKCAFDLDMKNEKDRRKNKFFRTIKKSRNNAQIPTIWMGKPHEKSPLVPVKAAVYSDYGSVVVHLVKLSE